MRRSLWDNWTTVNYPCGNFSDTSSLKFLKTKGSIGHAFTVCIHTENQNQRSFYPFVLHEISVLIELLLGHLCYRLTDVPPQPNSPKQNLSIQYRLLHPRYLGPDDLHPHRLCVHTALRSMSTFTGGLARSLSTFNYK
jgi:hypothetical protein